jgi:hypothetical protein
MLVRDFLLKRGIISASKYDEISVKIMKKGDHSHKIYKKGPSKGVNFSKMVLAKGLVSLLKGVDFFQKHPGLVPYIRLPLPLFPTKGVTLKFWYKHRYPQNMGSGGGAINMLELD